MKPLDRAPRAHPNAQAVRPARPEWRRRWVRLILGQSRRKRIRVAQWLVSAMTYAGCGLVLFIGFVFGWVRSVQLVSWLGLATIAQALFYLLVRSGLSEKARDPALTVPQILVGLAFADWGFLICGPGRAIALLPMLLVMVFGAFSLHWRKMAALTGLALGGFAMSLAGQQWLRHLHGDPQRPLELRQDLIYLSILVVAMPAAAGLSAQLSRLRSRLRAERAALALALANVQRLAAFDELTGLANRRHAHDYLAMAQARAYRDGASFAVVLIDLDHFKRINDTQGHGAGDKVLRAFAEASRAMLRPSDMMARWGGEEFLIVMPGTSAADAHAATTRLLQAVHALPTDSGHLLSFSAGVAEWKAGETFTMTMTRADGAMYAAKHAGRDQVRLAG